MPIDDEYVAIPADQLGDRAEGRSSFTVFDRIGDAEGPLVAVRVDLVEAEVERRYRDSNGQADPEALTRDAFNNPVNWIGDEQQPDEAQIAFFAFDPNTGRIGQQVS